MNGSEESGIGYRKIHLTPVFFARFFTLPRTFFITIFPTAFYDRSRMTGRYLNCSIKPILAYLLTLIFVLSCLLQLAPFVSSADTLAIGKASNSLLQRRFALQKVVRVLPDKRGRLSALRFVFVAVMTSFCCGLFPYFFGFAHTKRAVRCLCLFLLFCFPLFPLSELYFFVDFDDFSHVHAVVVVAVTAAVVFHVDFLVGVVVLCQFVGVDFFADEDEVRFFYGGGTV